ncbi:MAG: hypothetical protein HYX93_04085, partial [Chloroflexi bacterium]|nr:hypothetical protein [Chloroflexota bacterium]
FVAANLDDLLQILHGKIAETSTGPRTMDTQDLEVRKVGMGFVERFLLVLSDPNISFILLTVGGLGIVVELFNPGLIVPGVVGAICLLLAFVALGNLPVNWAGASFILLAMVLMFLEVQVAGFGILGVGAIISFVVGGLLLFHRFGAPSPTMPTIGVSPWVLVPVALIIVGGGSLVLYTMVRSRRTRPELTVSRLVGATGYVATDLTPRGTVQLEGELWSAVGPHDEVIRAGEEVQVTQVAGAVLTVARLSLMEESEIDSPSDHVEGNS